jgi:alpha-ketoglutarate-dependent taurine dioxygenase
MAARGLILAVSFAGRGSRRRGTAGREEEEGTAMSVSTELKTVDVAPLIGTSVETDIESLLSGRYVSELRDLLERRGVLVFPRLHMSKEQQLAFSATLGEPLTQGAGKVLNISLDKDRNKGAEYLADYFKGSFFWHIDQTSEDSPCRASLLTASKLSEVGGQTEFANTYAAWDALPEDEKRACDGLRVVHSLEAAQLYIKPEPSVAELEGWRRIPTKTHPLVWTHQSGRKSLVLGSTASHIEGRDLAEGRMILTRLREWATQPEFVYQHQWSLGDLVIWDNTGTMHRALPYPFDSGRLMIRTTLKGEELLA